jgi:hypothetical protein
VSDAAAAHRRAPAGALLAVLAALVLPFALAPADWAAWAFLLAALALAWVDPVVSGDREAGLGVLATAAAHGAVALTNSLAGPLPEAELDAAVFKAHALDIAMFEPLRPGLGSGLFENFLAALHTLLGTSPLMGDAAAAFAFVLASVFFVRLLHLLRVPRYRFWLVIAFGLWPTSLLLGSVTLREPFQLLAFTAMVYWGLRPARGLRRLGWLCAAALAGLAMGAFHAAMLAYAAVALVLLAIWPAAQGAGGGWRERVTALAVIALIGAGAALALSRVDIRSGDDLFAMAQHGLVDGLESYRAGIGAGEPRTAFGVDLEYESVPAFVASIGPVYAHYLFAPFPWEIGVPLDTIAAAESLLRLVLVVLAGVLLWRGDGPPRRMLALLLLLYAGMTLTWTLGTTNYGQALRHHVLSNWILLLTAGPMLAAGLHRALGRVAAVGRGNGR